MLHHNNSLPRVSVIIPVFNDAPGLKQTLTALQQQNYPQDKLEIIVVDNNSTDNSDQVAINTPGVTLVYEKEIQNAGAARNQGLRVATGEIIAFTDADCIPAPDWLVTGIQIIQQTGVDRIAGEVTIQPISSSSNAYALIDTLYNFNQQFLVKTYQACVTANLLVKRSVFEHIGYFVTNFVYSEDIELGRRATSAGFTLVYAPDCIVYHPPRDTFKALWKKGIRSGGGVFCICLQEKRGGFLGWKHFARVIKNLVSPRQLHWYRLPFSPTELSLQQRLYIYILLWVTISLTEAIGYTHWGLIHLKKMLIKQLKLVAMFVIGYIAKFSWSRKLLNKLYLNFNSQQKSFFHRYFAKTFREHNLTGNSGIWRVFFQGKTILIPLETEQFWLDWDTALSIVGHDIEVKDTYQALLNSSEAPELFIDIGANYGTHSLLFLVHDIETITFEPNPSCHHLFQAICSLNNVNPKLESIALGEKEGEIEIAYPEKDTWLGSTNPNVIKNLICDYKLVTVKALQKRLDEYLPQMHNKRTLIKIDTEGNELDVLKGGLKVLSDIKPKVIFESWGKSDRLEIFNFFKQYNYYIYHLPWQPQSKNLPLELEQFLTLPGSNFMAVPIS
jgi:FkbM family methyltransferase